LSEIRNTPAGLASAESFPSADALTHRWIVVILLSALAVISFVDKLIMSIIAQPISIELSLSDGQIALLMGPAFAILYALTSLPMAYLVDMHSRKRILLLGVLLWSVMTTLSGFAQGFLPLAWMRSGVAMGEAVLAPAAFSIIADLFRGEERAMPVTIYMIATVAAGVGALAIGGAVLMIATELSTYVGAPPWRLTLVAVGIPGLVVAFLFHRLVQEPARREGASSKPQPADMRAFGREITEKKAIYGGLLLSSGAFSFYLYCFLSWSPTIMVRAHGIEPAQAGILLGAILTPLSVISMYIWPRFATRINRRNPGMGVPSCMLLATLISALPFIIAPVMSSTAMFLLGAVGVSFVIGAWATLSGLALQAIAPSRMVARFTALNLLITNLLGYGLGPVTTVVLGKYLLDTGLPSRIGGVAEPIAWGLATQGIIAIAVMLIATLVFGRGMMVAGAALRSQLAAG
jgi:MFS family permease